MYLKILENAIRKTVTKVLAPRSFIEYCEHLKPGIFKCHDHGPIIALHKINGWSLDFHGLSNLDYVYNLKRFLEAFHIENCKTIFYSDVEPINVNEYLSKLNRKIQMKLIEFELDKTNIKLRNYIERLIETRKKVLMGIRPIKVMNIVALVCDNSTDVEKLEKLVHSAKNMLNIDLDPVNEQRLAELIINFRYNQLQKT